MSGASDHYEIGRGQPPRSTRWKKGECGNPNRIRRPRSLNVAELVEQAFARKIRVREGGRSVTKTVFEVIVLQLWAKVLNGNVRAAHVLVRYQRFAAGRGGRGGVKIVFEPPHSKAGQGEHDVNI
jgi:hypothetical protein